MKNRLLISLLFAAAAFGSYWIVQADKPNQNIKVKVEPLGLASFNEELVFQGIVFPKENVPISISTPTIIRKIHVKEGHEVEEGDILVEFSAITEENLQRELKIVDLNISSAKLELNNLTSGSTKLSLEELELEQKSLEEEIKSLKRDIELAVFESETLGKQADATGELLKKGGISSIEANEARVSANKKDNELEDLKTSLAIFRQKYELSVLSYQRLRRELFLNQNNIQSEYQKLLGEKESLERKLAEIREPLKAPFDGIITEITVTEGDFISQGGKLLSMSPGNEFLVRLEVSPHLSKWIELDQEVKIKSRGNFDNKTYIGRVYDIGKIARVKKGSQSNKRVIDIEIMVEEPEGMKPGYLADVEINGVHSNGVSSVNSFSVIEEGGINYVYVLEGEVARKTQVDIGVRAGTKYEVLNLPLEIEIIVNPFKVKDGQSVTVVK